MAGPGFVPKWLRRNAHVAPKRTSWPDKPRNQRWIDFLRSTGLNVLGRTLMVLRRTVAVGRW